MATYCFKCGAGHTWSGPAQVSTGCPKPDCTDPDARRDYKAESVGFAVAALAHDREFSVKSHKDQFLPTAADYAGPSDPSGQKGLRAWRESVRPAEGNKRPETPSGLDKRVF